MSIMKNVKEVIVMNKLEVGMYVRTKQGYIAKFKKYDEIFDMLRFETPIFLRSWMPCDYMQKERFMNRYFLKASYNIIDILEVGDYVNGHRVEEIDFENEEIFTDSEYYCGIVEFCNIKSVITHEQIEQMEYKVESEVK